MSNDFYNITGSPSTGSSGSSAVMRAEFAAIQAGFDKMPSLSGNANNFLAINAGATGITSLTAAQARAALALVIGTNVQAWDADLDAIAALTSAANKAPYCTGAQAWALMDCTAAGRAILGAADAPAQRTALGLGTAATADVGVGVQAYDANTAKTNAAQSFTKTQAAAITALSSGVAADYTAGQHFSVNVNGSTFTIANPSANPSQDGAFIAIYISFTTANTVAFGTAYLNVAKYTATATAGKRDYLLFRWNSTAAKYELVSFELDTGKA